MVLRYVSLRSSQLYIRKSFIEVSQTVLVFCEMIERKNKKKTDNSLNLR